MLSNVFIQKLHDIRVGFSHVLKVAAEYRYLIIILIDSYLATLVMNLSSQAIVFEFTGELYIFKPMKYDLYRFHRFG